MGWAQRREKFGEVHRGQGVRGKEGWSRGHERGWGYTVPGHWQESQLATDRTLISCVSAMKGEGVGVGG